MPIKWKPFSRNLGPFSELERPFNNDEEDWIPFMPVPSFKIEEPAIDIYQDKTSLYIEMPLNGLSPENVDISISDNILTISGKIEEAKDIKEKDYIRKEIRRGSFRRSVKLPSEARGGKIEAEVVKGMLKITIAKNKISAPAKKIPIKISK